MTQEEIRAMVEAQIKAGRTAAMQSINASRTGSTTPAASTTTPTTPVSATPAATSAASTAKDPWATLADIDKMSGAERLYAGLKFGYDQADEELAKQGRKDISTFYRNGLSRGMQRSSYVDQTAANMFNQNSEQRDKKRQEFISELSSALTNQEYQDWQKQFQQAQFDWQKESADRQLAASYVNAILAAGGTPSDDLLARAGLSSADFAAMKASAAASGGGGGGGGTGNGTNNKPGPGNQNGNNEAFAEQFAKDLESIYNLKKTNQANAQSRAQVTANDVLNNGKKAPTSTASGVIDSKNKKVLMTK